jgi:hypothetical protein
VALVRVVCLAFHPHLCLPGETIPSRVNSFQ